MTLYKDELGVRGKRSPKWAALLCGVSAVSLLSAMTAVAQEGVDDEARQEVIVVQGIRGSLERAMDLKRESNGVLDAISAEDIGKFPDTNLAESLQRITGVSIDRSNGEGSKITVRGFGPDFNLVTLNGRTLPTADIGVIGERGNYGAGGDRSFDFSNLASEGVSSLEVYKTGQAILPSGGIGATVNIRTRRPLDNPGFQASAGVKIMNDTSVEAGDDYTPELTGLASWTDNTERFGVGVFGSYSKRDSGAPTQQVNDWLVFDPAVDGIFADSGYVRGDGSTQVTNAPADDQLWAVPQDSRYDFSDLSRERLNGQLVLQFRPMDNLTLTGDVTYASNESDEDRYEQTNWFATPFDQVVFDNDGPVATAVFLQENNNGTKDIGFEQTNRATKDELTSIGFNADWELNDRARVILDAHTSEATSGGNNPLGHSATFVAIGAPVNLQHSVDFRSGYPIQSFTTDDSASGNNNGMLDVGDLATQVARSAASNMKHEVDEIDLRFVWEFDSSSLTVGGNYRDTTMERSTRTTQQDLGSWGFSNPRDVEQFAPGVMEAYCLSCLFDDIPVGQADTAFRGSATDLFTALTAAYAGNSDNLSETHDIVGEEITSLFAQFEMESELLNRPARVSAGIRYEDTKVTSVTQQSIPSGVLWISDNDFLVQQSGAKEDLSGEGSYDHLLPNIDFQIDVTDNIVARASYSKTIGRVAYSSLFASTTAAAPNRPTALGGQVTGSSQNPALLPLESDNFDVSLEWYYGDTSYVSVGYFDKRVKNFVGNGVVDRNLFGLRDPASGVAGTRSGDALDVIDALGVDRSEANMFTMVALIDANNGNVAAAQAEFQANLVNGALPQTYVDTILGLYDVSADANDPLLSFAVSQPINNKEGNIDGIEFAWQHFFGDTGLGFAANYTMVNGDVELDPASPPSENQFALVGLSDSANITAIYENYGFSARLAYNWRDTFLQQTNQTGDRSGIYVEDFGQFDLNVSYDINENVAVSFEAINITGEDQRVYHRVPEQFYYSYELSPRYLLGARYKF
ncbi:TonB-dependent receptor [Hyphomonas johnsonii]|uniref:TonB-dependent receptor n=1 Tax=Hyphomonas johnsonii MHS-2 TaxID=1280950 RepID=A0A059FS58_9PROT|nr:TonB-dependent receptor [Hyphomonas johnsonii]KCZ93356.1 TonB-dependent receptor [Hyphomonas johnsonii MHS-2]